VRIEGAGPGKGSDAGRVFAVFTPYYTTKLQGIRGLGLAIVQSVVSDHREHFGDERRGPRTAFRIDAAAAVSRTHRDHRASRRRRMTIIEPSTLPRLPTNAITKKRYESLPRKSFAPRRRTIHIVSLAIRFPAFRLGGHEAHRLRQRGLAPWNSSARNRST